MDLGGSRAVILATTAILSACSLVSGLGALERAAGESNDAGTDGSSTGDAATDASAPDSPVDAATDGGADAAIDSANAYVDAVLADSPIAYYRLDETSGTSVVSAITGAPSGTFTRGVTLGNASPVTGSPANRAAIFALSATDDSNLGFGDNFSFAGTASFTVELWVNPTATSASSGAMHLFSKADRFGSTPTNGWNICIEPGSGGGAAPVVWIERFVGGTGVLSAKAPITLGAFTHVVAVYDGTLSIYTNATPTAASADGRTMTAPTTSAFAGSADGTTGHGLIGQLDEIAIYDKALSHARVAAHYALGKP